MSDRTKRFSRAGVALVIGCAVAIVGGYSARQTLVARHFSPTGWKAAVQEPRYDRRKMADWLLRRQFVLDRRRSEIVDLLGQPWQSGHNEGEYFLYCLGPFDDCVIFDADWLVIRFDKGERVWECQRFGPSTQPER